MSKWNGKRFSIYTSDEENVLNMVEELGKQTNHNTDELKNKTDLHGNHLGAWQGLNRPTMSDEGMRATVEDIIDNKIPAIETSLDNIAKHTEGYVNVKEYAKNIINNDYTSVFKEILSNNELKTIIIPEGEYYIKETLYIDLSKHSVIGIGLPKIYIKGSEFVGNEIICLYNTTDWSNRKYRQREIKNFIIQDIEDKRFIDGIRIGGKSGTIYEGHVESLTLENIFIEGVNSRLKIGSHVYMNVINKIYGRWSNYYISCDDNITDSKENLKFYNCFFVDNGKVDLKNINATFTNCSFHPNMTKTATFFNVDSDSHIILDKCHFENILQSDINIICNDIFTVNNMSELVLNNCYFVVSPNGGSITVNNSMFNIKNNSIVRVNNPKWFYYITRLSTGTDFVLFKTKATTNYGKYYINGFILDLTVNTSQVPKISDCPLNCLDTTILKGSNKITPTLSDGVISLEVNNLEVWGGADYSIGVDVQLSNSSIIFVEGLFNKGDCTRVMWQNSSLTFYDSVGKKITDDETTKFNNGKNMFAEQTGTGDLNLTYYRTFRNIPKNAVKCEVRVFYGVNMNTKSTGTIKKLNIWTI